MGGYNHRCHHPGLILRAAQRGVLYCTRDENQEPTFFVLREAGVPVAMKIYERDRATIMLAVIHGLMRYEKYLPHNYNLGTGQLRLTAAGERHYEAAMKHLREKEHCRDEKHKPRRQEREREDA